MKFLVKYIRYCRSTMQGQVEIEASSREQAEQVAFSEQLLNIKSEKQLEFNSNYGILDYNWCDKD